MVENCKVTKVKNNYAYIELKKEQKCEGCNACHFNSEGKLNMPAIMEVPCEVGDTVAVEMPQKQPSWASLILFAVPLVMFLIGLAIGRIAGTELVMILLGFMFLAVGVALGIVIENLIKTRKEYMPIVVKRLFGSDAVENTETNETTEVTTITETTETVTEPKTDTAETTITTSTNEQSTETQPNDENLTESDK